MLWEYVWQHSHNLKGGYEKISKTKQPQWIIGKGSIFSVNPSSLPAPIFAAIACSRNTSPHFILVWGNLFPHHLHSLHKSFERTSQTQTELSFYTQVPNSPRLLLAHVVQNQIWVDPREPRCFLTAWIENSFLMHHPTFDLLFLDYVFFPA